MHPGTRQTWHASHPARPPCAAVVSVAVVVVFLLAWALFARRALRDHRLLPHCRYKESHIFVRVQLRCLGPVQVSGAGGQGGAPPAGCGSPPHCSLLAMQCTIVEPAAPRLHAVPRVGVLCTL